MNKKILTILSIVVFAISFMLASMSNKTKATDINQKICWGIKEK